MTEGCFTPFLIDGLFEESLIPHYIGLSPMEIRGNLSLQARKVLRFLFLETLPWTPTAFGFDQSADSSPSGVEESKSASFNRAEVETALQVKMLTEISDSLLQKVSLFLILLSSDILDLPSSSSEVKTQALKFKAILINELSLSITSASNTARKEQQLQLAQIIASLYTAGVRLSAGERSIRLWPLLFLIETDCIEKICTQLKEIMTRLQSLPLIAAFQSAVQPHEESFLDEYLQSPYFSSVGFEKLWKEYGPQDPFVRSTVGLRPRAPAGMHPSVFETQYRTPVINLPLQSQWYGAEAENIRQYWRSFRHFNAFQAKLADVGSVMDYWMRSFHQDLLREGLTNQETPHLLNTGINWEVLHALFTQHFPNTAEAAEKRLLDFSEEPFVIQWDELIPACQSELLASRSIKPEACPIPEVTIPYSSQQNIYHLLLLICKNSNDTLQLLFALSMQTFLYQRTRGNLLLDKGLQNIEVQSILSSCPKHRWFKLILLALLDLSDLQAIDVKASLLTGLYTLLIATGPRTPERALRTAALNGEFECVRFLVKDMNIAFNAANERGDTPRTLAESRGHTVVTQWLDAWKAQTEAPAAAP